MLPHNVVHRHVVDLLDEEQVHLEEPVVLHRHLHDEEPKVVVLEAHVFEMLVEHLQEHLDDHINEFG